MADGQREKLMKKVENHLRITSRQLIKIDTEEEALQYLTDSFRSRLYCDFVGVILHEDGQLIPKAWSGDVAVVDTLFPLLLKECSPKILHQSLTYEKADSPNVCRLSYVLQKVSVKTWFTVPIKDETHYFGFCIIGFLSYVPLFDMETSFEEFGKDIAVSIAMVRQKETQLKKIEGIEWISKNLSLDSSLEENIMELTLRAAKGTNADFACIYLYNEKENNFVLQLPSYGEMEQPHTIMIEENYVLREYFPFLEISGGKQLTIPIVIDLKPIGVLHVENKKDRQFTEDDLRMLGLLSEHIATMLENARLYNNEKEHKQRLHFLLDYQQALVKETVRHNDFDSITAMLSDLFKDSVILFDRFIRPISYKIHQEEIIEKLEEAAAVLSKYRQKINVFTVLEEDGKCFYVWPVSGGDHLLGYLAIHASGREMDEFDQLTIELARNICSIQFIKQKLVLDAKEQMKDSFISKLLVERVENEESVLQYANLFQWNPFRHHRLVVLSMILSERELHGCNLLEQQAKKAVLWDYIKSRITEKDKSILSASFQDTYVLIVPIDYERDKTKEFWENFYSFIKKCTEKVSVKCQVKLGIGGKTESIQDYYMSYQQSVQALHVLQNRFKNKGFALFEELGSYTILHHLGHSQSIDLFINHQLGPLLKYSEGKNIDLLNTLHVFLQNNGNVKNTAEELYIHRSSLLYRLERAEQLLEADLNNAEVRFNLMMALKLFDMYGSSINR